VVSAFSTVCYTSISLVTLSHLRTQTLAATESANAAKSAAQTASYTLAEIKKGGSDTHDLAVAAKTHADRTKEIAESSANQVNQLKGMVTASSKQAASLSGQLSVMQKQLEVAERPWVAVVGTQLMSGFTYIPTEARVTIRVSLRDVGHSPCDGRIDWGRALHVG
jgi:hypothetical protein